MNIIGEHVYVARYNTVSYSVNSYDIGIQLFVIKFPQLLVEYTNYTKNYIGNFGIAHSSRLILPVSW